MSILLVLGHSQAGKKEVTINVEGKGYSKPLNNNPVIFTYVDQIKFY